jgi:hypothetical protein
MSNGENIGVLEAACRSKTLLTNNESVVLLLLVLSPWAGLAGTRAQSGDRYVFCALQSRQVFRGSLPLPSPAFRRSHVRRQMPPRPHQRGRS